MNRPMVCKRGLNDIWINEYDGKVRICGWSNYYIGSLVEDTIEEIWNGELAQKFRDSMLDGSYRYCNHAKCPYCANGHLDEMLIEYNVPKLPKSCSLSYQLQCNYACKFCRTEHYVPCECEKSNYATIEAQIRKMLPTLDELTSNGAGEFFCSDSIIRFINEEEINSNTKILIETNGSLFTPKNWAKIQKLGKHDLTVAITIHSFIDSTYRYLSGTTLSVEQVKENLSFVSKLRKEGIVNNFEIATVICERNFREIPDFVKQCLKDYDMDTIRLRFFEPYGVMDPLTEWFYDVRNEKHPYNDEYVKVMSDPILKHPKVWRWQGEKKSLQSESPYVLEKRKGDALAKLVLLDSAKEKLHDYMNKVGAKRIALYGAANVGVAVLKLLNMYDIPVTTIFDSYSHEKKTDAFEIQKPTENAISEYDLIIISTDTFATQIKEDLSRMRFNGVVKTLSMMVDELND